jgi:hypothetical protein
VTSYVVIQCVLSLILLGLWRVAIVQRNRASVAAESWKTMAEWQSRYAIDPETKQSSG